MKKYFLLSLILVLIFSGCSLTDSKNELKPLPATGKPVYDNMDFNGGEILIKINSQQGLEEVLEGYGAKILHNYESLDWLMVTVPDNFSALDFLKKLEEEEQILFAEPNLNWYLPEPESRLGFVQKGAPARDYEKLWAMEAIKAPEAWEVTTGASNIIVAIVDTGLDLDHPEFREQTIIAPYNATGDSWLEDVQDVHGHGSHVAGTAAANGRQGQLAGVVWDSPIMPVRVMDRNGQILSGYLAEAITYIADFIIANPQYRAVINMSIGGRGYSYLLKDALDYAYEAGILLVAAAGNDYKRVMAYPAAYNGVVSVAASTPFGEKAEFSSLGHWNSVAAPGVSIWSAIPTYFANTDQAYSYMEGTSMAAPHVCGALALLLASNPSLSPLEIKNQVEETARPGKFTEELGYGIIDCQALLGPLAEMKYGSLNVETDLVYGLVTVFDQEGQMRYFGATGKGKNHYFPAILPGSYRVTLSYGNLIQDIKEVEIRAKEKKNIQLKSKY